MDDGIDSDAPHCILTPWKGQTVYPFVQPALRPSAGFPLWGRGRAFAFAKNRLIISSNKHNTVLKFTPTEESFWSVVDNIRPALTYTRQVYDWSWQAFSSNYFGNLFQSLRITQKTIEPIRYAIISNGSDTESTRKNGATYSQNIPATKVPINI